MWERNRDKKGERNGSRKNEEEGREVAERRARPDESEREEEMKKTWGKSKEWSIHSIGQTQERKRDGETRDKGKSRRGRKGKKRERDRME